ncbi:rRNA maturation RNase YbeY, partial [Patescibacteria group bacterium]|nr:rRNA maturation RNase YbeY [Patescibacteria group bacterium]
MLEIHNFTQNEIDEKFFQKIVEKALKIVDVKNDIEISLAIVGDGRIRKLNKMYRGNNRVTDILSFS